MLLGAATLLHHRRWRPIRARGLLSACLGVCCGLVWLYTAAARVAGEALGYDAGQHERWAWWLTYIPGLGGWLAVQVLHLRSLAQIHVFEAIPTALALELFLALLAFGLPLCYMQRAWLLTAQSAVVWLYALLLYSELWPILRHVAVRVMMASLPPPQSLRTAC
jgi:hypothetical protein